MLSLKVKHAIQQAHTSLLVNGYKEGTFSALLHLAVSLHFNLKSANQEYEELNRPFMPLTE